MSEERQQRIGILRARQRYARASKEVVQFLSSCNYLSFVGLLDPSVTSISSWDLYRATNRWDTEPFTKVASEAGASELTAWVRFCLEALGVGDEYYLALGNWLGVPWANIKVTDPDHWLFSLWSELQPRELILLSSEQERYLLFAEREHCYCAHLGEVGKLIKGTVTQDDSGCTGGGATST
jgi:hypothetical protein